MTLDTLIQWVHTHPHWGGFITFIISAAESVAIIGTIVPGSVMMTAIGTMVGSGILPIWSTLIWAIAGAVVGDGISYWAGFAFKTKIRGIWPFTRYHKLLNTGEFFFVKHGAKSVTIGRFVGPVRAIVPLVAGMMGMRPIRFYIANIISAIGWAPAYMLPGYLLGAASLQLPPDVAIHIILSLLIFIGVIIFGAWLIRVIYGRIGDWLHYNLELYWAKLKSQKEQHLFTELFRRADGHHHYGQMGAGLLVLFLSLFFIFLAFNAAFHGPLTHWNDIVYNFFRSIRNYPLDKVILAISYFGEKKVVLPTLLILFIAYAYKRHWRAAWHLLSLGVIAAIAIVVIKHLVASPRPGGIVQQVAGFSFPSGHATLAIAFYGFITILLTREIERRSVRKIIYYLAGILIACIDISRMYLNAHWLTDVVGGLVLGGLVLTLVRISYFREHQPRLNPKFTFLITIIALAVLWTAQMELHFKKDLHNCQRIWKIKNISMKRWWESNGKNIPMVRKSRLNHPVETLNVQWAGQMTSITKNLEAQGWQTTPHFLWSDLLHPIKLAQRTQRLPLLPRLFDAQSPANTLIIVVNKTIYVLRLWQSHIVLTPNKALLWLGSIDSHEDNLAKQRNNRPQAEAVLKKYLKSFDWKERNFPFTTLGQGHHTFKVHSHLILIKPKDTTS